MTERRDPTEAGEGGPALAASSYAADGRLLAELRAAWPAIAAGPARAPGRGYLRAPLGDRPPDAALRLGDRHAVALVAESGGAFFVVLLARDEVAVDAWRRAEPGDGLSAFAAGVPSASERAIAADQTNASVVVGERAIVKWFRRIGPGPGRAATLLAHLDAVGFGGIPAPLGSLTWRSPAGVELTIAQGDAYLAGASDGWDWCLARLERHAAHGETPCPADCDPWIGRPLGRLVARLHGALRTPSSRDRRARRAGRSVDRRGVAARRRGDPRPGARPREGARGRGWRGHGLVGPRGDRPGDPGRPRRPPGGPTRSRSSRSTATSTSARSSNGRAASR